MIRYRSSVGRAGALYLCRVRVNSFNCSGPIACWVGIVSGEIVADIGTIAFLGAAIIVGTVGFWSIVGLLS